MCHLIPQELCSNEQNDSNTWLSQNMGVPQIKPLGSWEAD